MKRSLSVAVMVLVILVGITGVSNLAIAAYMPPATLCFTDWNYDLKYSLLIKQTGNIRMLKGPERLYSIQGFLTNGSEGYPAVGSGYMQGNVFHFTLSVTYYQMPGGKPYLYFVQGEGFWDVVAHTGYMYAYFSYGQQTLTFNFQPLSCAEINNQVN